MKFNIQKYYYKLFDNKKYKKLKQKQKISKISMKTLIENYFKVNVINNSSRNPFEIELLNNFNDDEKWLMMSESRPQTMSWLLLKPKKTL